MNQNGSTIRWTTPTGEKIIWNSETVHMMSLMSHMPQAQRLPFLTYAATHLMGCSRCCIILQKDSDDGKNKKLVIVAGHPDHEHGIGSEISSALGKDFLESVIKIGKIVSIVNPKHDPRVAYMKSLIIHRGIRSLILVPLYYKKMGDKFIVPPFGVLALDYTSKDPEKKLEKDNREVREIVRLTVELILSEQRKINDNYELMKIACAETLGQHSLAIQDALGNFVTKLPFIEKTFEEISKAKEALKQAEKTLQKAEEFALTMKDAVDQFAFRADDALSAVRFNSSKLALEKHDLQKFFEEFADQKRAEGIKINVKLDFSRLRQRRMRFDRKKLSDCFGMLLNNSLKFDAKDIIIEVFSKNGTTNSDKNVITFSRDGTRFGPLMKKQVFMLYGLSTVKSIIEAHKGKISVAEFQKTTRFIIHLPFN